MAERPLEREKADPSGRGGDQEDRTADMPGVKAHDADEGLRHESDDAANSTETVDDLTGSSDPA